MANVIRSRLVLPGAQQPDSPQIELQARQIAQLQQAYDELAQVVADQGANLAQVAAYIIQDLRSKNAGQPDTGPVAVEGRTESGDSIGGSPEFAPDD